VERKRPKVEPIRNPTLFPMEKMEEPGKFATTRWKFPKQDHFLAVLVPFLKKLPADHKFVIEIRNKTWLDARFADVLREYNVALALTDTSFMPRPWELKQKFDLITADFAYVRWLGDRKGIEKQTTTWDKTVIDRTSDLRNWVEVFKSLVSNTKVLKIFAYSNNHYAGHGPATAKLFMDLWNIVRLSTSGGAFMQRRIFAGLFLVSLFIVSGGSLKQCLESSVQRSATWTTTGCASARKPSARVPF